MQAIVTKFLGESNTRGKRIKASCEAKSVVYPWDYSLEPAANHERAALRLTRALEWDALCYPGAFYSGALPDGSFAHVFAHELMKTATR